MHARNRRPCVLQILPIIALIVFNIFAAACSQSQPSRFQMSFLPAAPHPAIREASELPAAPAPKINIDPRDVPKFLVENPSLPPKKTRADALMLAAEEKFQRGKRYYDVGDFSGARREFDSAIDLMLEASAFIPADRQDYERRLETLADSIHRFDLADLGASAEVEDGRFEKAPLEDILPMTFPVDPKLKARVREQMSATVSQLPLSVNDTVLGYINYFSNRGYRTIVAAKQRSGRYRPMIQRILDEEGVPQELIHLAQAESGFIPRAMSRKAAGGMWQFMTFRGNEYGLMQTRYTDERMDPEKATRAAARHLRDLYNQFGDWYLAIAAYNCGPYVVEKAVERTGHADFWELRRRAVLPAETTNYVPIIVAMTLMEKNATHYRLDNIAFDAPLEYDTVEMTALTSLALVSDITGTPLVELAGMNPAVLKGMIPEKFSIHIPKGTGNQLLSTLETVPTGSRCSWRMHRVGPDETLAEIGRRYGASASAIAAANRLSSEMAVEGDRLLIPVSAKAAPAGSVRRTSSRTVTVSHRAPAKSSPRVIAAVRKP
jgi:peptidoglycan lytic transglycosylase D